MQPNKIENLKTLFLQSAKRYPDNLAITVEEKEYTYKELCCISLSIAKIVMKHSSKMCAILCDRNIYAYASILGTLFSDKTYVPFSRSQKISRAIEVFKESKAEILIVDKSFEDIAREIVAGIEYEVFVIFVDYDSLPAWSKKSNACFNFTNDSILHHKCDLTTLNCCKNDAAYLLFTSGSTGKPKGVIISHRQVLCYLSKVIEIFRPMDTDRFSQAIDLTFDLSIHDMFLCWAVGACLCVFNGDNVIDLYKYIRSNKLTFWLSTPSIATLLLQAKFLRPGIFHDLKNSFFCGEPLSSNLVASWSNSAANSSIINLYGPTEATIAFTYYIWQEDVNSKNKAIPIGKPFDDLQAILLDDKLKRVKNGDTGEIFLSGVQVATGYYNDSQLSYDKFIKLSGNDSIWYRTGDLAYITDDGNMVFVGRRDDQIQLKGCRVEKLELEILLKNILDTEEVYVVPIVSKENLATGYVAYISGVGLENKLMFEKCLESMPSYLVPTKILKLENVPKTINGKIDYKSLQSLVQNDYQ